MKDMIHVSQPHCAHFGYSLTEEGSVQLGWTSGEGKAIIGDCNGFIHHQMISPRNIPMAPYDPMDSNGLQWTPQGNLGLGESRTSRGLS
jgi:hypothetical protein